MQIEEIGFVNDVIQDNRSSARTEQAYDFIIEAIFNNVKLNWNKDGLILKSDEKLFNVIEVLEPDTYNRTLKILQEEENKQEENKNE